MPSTGSPLPSTAEAPSNSISSLLPANSTAATTTATTRISEPEGRGDTTNIAIPEATSGPVVIGEASDASRHGPSSPLKLQRSPRSPGDVRKAVFSQALEKKLGTSGSNPWRQGGGGPKCQSLQHEFSSDEGGDSTPTPQGTPSSTLDSTLTPGPKPDSQIQLNKYRERLARDLSARGGKPRVSPIQEEAARSPPPTASTVASSDLTTASTESGQTIRATPMPTGSAFPSAATPSYPFPRMGTPGQLSAALNHPFPNLSPGVFATNRSQFEGFSTHDRLVSENSTPASAMTFHPDGGTGPPGMEDADYPTPNLYDLSLMLSAEPGLEAWWDTVVQIMTEVYKAERISLAVPADATDIENVPWGQIATYCSLQDDELSNGYIARGDGQPPTASTAEDGPSTLRSPAVEIPPSESFLARPILQSRHSFTKFEDEKGKASPTRGSHIQRPSFLSRSKSYFPSTHHRAEEPVANFSNLNHAALQEHDSLELPQTAAWGEFISPPEHRARVHPVLQAFTLEADPLIDTNGILRVVERGKVIALTRSYPYLGKGSYDQNEIPKQASKVTEEKRKFKKPRADSSTKLSSILSTAANYPGKRASIDQSIADDSPQTETTPKYEEYEQPPPSPWTQSPAPSPAVRADPSDNPFFRDATVDEDSFNPSNTPETYNGMRPPEAIGVDNSWTVLHVPLPHLILSKRTHGAFKLDPSAVEAKFQARNKKGSPVIGSTTSSNHPAQSEPVEKDKPAPTAILSILSPVIPYPSNWRHSLENLAPHLATTFSLARHHYMLETEIAGLHRRGPGPGVGFGGVDSDGRPVEDVSRFGAPFLHPRLLSQQSIGSITSPSDYSGPARSSTASPGLTPSWETTSLGLMMDSKRIPSASPSVMTGDSYFGAKGTTGKTIAASNAGMPQKGPKRGIADGPQEKRHHARVPSSKTSSHDSSPSQPTTGESQSDDSSREPQQLQQPQQQGLSPKLEDITQLEIPTLPRQGALGLTNELSEEEEEDYRRAYVSKRRTMPDSSRKHHTQLHSYGADFSTTAQSLPPGHSPAIKSSGHPGPLSRSSSMNLSSQDHPYPSLTLRVIILDLLPLQIFVAKPQTGEIAWVNSRFLSYRGQNIGGLASDPYGALHPEDRPEYLKKWAQCVRAGTPLETDTLVRIKRFDGQYRRFAVRAIPIRDQRGVVTHFLGSFMDVHKQYMAEMEAKTKLELEASEAKHRLLANLIPQIIFTATEDEGITFANEQWLSYTGQTFDDALGLGFMDYVHPDDLARCRIPSSQSNLSFFSGKRPGEADPSSGSSALTAMQSPSPVATPEKRSKWKQPISRTESSTSSTAQDVPSADLAELARKGVVKVARDSSGRQSYTTEVRLRSRTGEYRWHLIRCVEIDNVDFGNGASSYFGSATDINDHKLLEAKLQEAMDSKSRFLSNMSHEIRTPLIGISGMVSFLQDTTLNEEQRDYTNTIQTSAKSLLLIINDILDLSKVDAGMMKLSYEWFHTRSLIEDVNELVWTMAVSKGLELNYVVEQDVPSWVKGDRVRIRQVLLNVIGNAIKFTSEGEVFSHCRVHVGDDLRGLGEHEIVLEFSIIDTGRGFSREEAELIFKPFSQIDGSSTRQHGGSGLGLVISRQLVELHGGRMSGSAEPGEGSTFTFTARFGLPSDDDRPDIPTTPQQLPLRQGLPLLEAASIKQVKPAAEHTSTAPPADGDTTSPQTTLASSGSSDPSVGSGVRSPTTTRSSASSVNAGLTRFGEAARATGQDLSHMKLEMPSGRSSPGTTPTPESAARQFKPRTYSILIVCPQKYNRKAIKMHIEMTLPRDVPSQITSMESMEDARRLLAGEDPVTFTHVVLNCPKDGEAIILLDTVMQSPKGANTTVLFLTDSKQRQAILKATKAAKYQQVVSENRVLLIPKPAKPFRFAVIFDPARERDFSVDHNRSRALQIVENQKQSYLDAERRMGNKGFKVLLVEDNLVNQKVLLKYLLRIGLKVDVANDGVEGTEKVFSHDHSHYAMVLCDLHMPRKDGYQACQEIRDWEKKLDDNERLPIIALSANVMSDVGDKCLDAGFSDYVTKPVDFGDLSTAMSSFF
ncbi:histidine kinase hhk2p [Zalerion maritima]|uniref:histidine kinase n=1 Tax=Zalerion maritima TaxID=339359 RepID=A0AAD5WRK4_9PEZI|nr:histidine kinase hhk2p [Zalerion maritima]